MKKQYSSPSVSYHGQMVFETRPSSPGRACNNPGKGRAPFCR